MNDDELREILRFRFDATEELLSSDRFLAVVRSILDESGDDAQRATLWVDALICRLDGLARAWEERERIIQQERMRKNAREKQEKGEAEQIKRARQALTHLREAARLMNLPENHFISRKADPAPLSFADKDGRIFTPRITPRLEGETDSEYKARCATIELAHGAVQRSTPSLDEEMDRLFQRPPADPHYRATIVASFDEEMDRLFQRVGDLFDSANLKKHLRFRGRATDIEGAARAAAIRSLHELIPDGIDARPAAISDLLSLCGIRADRKLVRSTLLGGRT